MCIMVLHKKELNDLTELAEGNGHYNTVPLVYSSWKERVLVYICSAKR